MKSMYNVSILPGDGVGREVIPEAIKVLESCMKNWKFKLDFTQIECGAEYYLKSGKEWDKDSFNICKKSDAILFGAVGLPGILLDNGQNAGSNVLFSLRFGLDLYANVRPAKLYPNIYHKVHDSFKRVWDKVNFIIVRENTEGIYTPIRGTLSRGGIDEMAVDTRVITRKGAERIIRFAFELTKYTSYNGKRKVTCVDKSNVLKGCQLFREIFYEVGKDYPHILTEYYYVDSFALNVIREPERFDVIVTSNLMGDILSDLSAGLQGGLGIAPSGNIGTNHAMFEPVHGSAPDIAGKNLANPIGAILSAGMMLDWLGRKYKDKKMIAASIGIESAVVKTLKKGKHLTKDIGGDTLCSNMGKAIIDEL